MKRISLGAVVALAIAAPCLHAEPADQAKQGNTTEQDALYRTVSALDAEFFGAFNHCDAPDQLQKHAAFMDPKVEFYHDTGGVSWTRQDYIDKTHRNVCGTYRRELTPGSLEIYPIKDFGAIEEGKQEFCDIKSGKCFGAAKFLIVWKRTPDGWHITRVFSYGHHAI
jgi:Domain of unknown function (DUF4440)